MLRFSGITLPFKIFYRIVRDLRRIGFYRDKKPRFELLSPGMEHPIVLRFDSSDRHVYKQIFLDQEYAPVKDIQAVRLIVDCGAYTGLSGRYLLQQFPDAQLVCVEPNVTNFALCRENLSPYASQVKFLNRGIWSHTTGLVISKEVYRDGREWTFQVHECPSGSTPDLQSIGLGDILREYPDQAIDLLKLDVERAEREIFARNTEQWLPQVRNIAIELHDEECREVFFKAMEPYDFECIYSGDLTICKNIKAKT